MNRTDDDYIFLESITLLTREPSGDAYEIIHGNGMDYVHAESSEAIISVTDYIKDIPSFLSEQLEYLLKSASSLKDILDTSVHIDDYPRSDAQDYKHGSMGFPTEINGECFYKAAGRYDRWEDFEKLYLSVFTERRDESLIGDRFMNVDGDLYYSASAFMSLYSFETYYLFTLTSESDSVIIVDITVKSYSTPKPTEHYEYEEVHYTVEFVLTDNGWRIN